MYNKALVLALAVATCQWLLLATEAAKDNGGINAFPFSDKCLSQWPSAAVSVRIILLFTPSAFVDN